MKHSLKISVSDKPVSGGILACRKVSLRKKVLDKLLGPEQKVTVIVPGQTVECISIKELAEGGPPAPEKPQLTLEEVRAVLAEKSHDGFTKEIRELLEKYGAPRLSEIDPANYAALMKDAEVLGNAT